MGFKRVLTENDGYYVTLYTKILRDPRVSLKAKALFLTVMGLPSTWNFSVKGIVSILKESKDAIYSGIDELEAFGYVRREQERGEDGRLGEMDYLFFNSPPTESPDQEIPYTENPYTVDPPQYKKQRIEETKKEEYIPQSPDPAVGEGSLPPGEPPTARKPDPVVEVFDYWVRKMGKNRAAKLTSDRRQKVKARLREGYTVEQIKQAIDGCSIDPFYMGDNVSGKTYNDLTLICRTGSKIEEFIERAEGPFAQKPQASLPSGTDLTLPSRSTWADLQEVMALDAEINGNWAPFLDPVAYRKAAGEYAARGPVEKAEVDEYENSPAYVKRFDIAPF